MEEEEFYAEIGKLIKRYRSLNNMTQEQLSAKVNLTRASITNIERGQQKISIYTLHLISKSLKISPDKLLPKMDQIEGNMNELDRNLFEIKKETTKEEFKWIENVVKKSNSE